jgi:hypothetical protein
MATGTSRPSVRRKRRAILPAVAALVLLLGSAALVALHRPAAAATPAAFAWLHPGGPPAGWRLAVIPSGARLPYPPGWQRIESDPGTVSAAPAGRRGAFRGYLNATPRSGAETLANWSRFRVRHVAGEGATHVRLEAAAHGLAFRNGHGSCVIDSYSTERSRFREIACIVAGRRGTTVVVAAAPVAHWAARAPVLERAVASFAT